MTCSKDRKFWEEFIELFKKFPCLWDTKSKEYLFKHKKDNAYTVLVEKCKEIYGGADKEFVVKRIANMRTTFRREMKKVQRSKEIRNSQNEVYVPSLWYFDHLLFLYEEGSGRNDCSTVDDEISNLSPDVDESQGFEEKLSPVQQPSSSMPTLNNIKRKKTIKSRSRKKHKLLKAAANCLSNDFQNEDEFEVTGKKIAFQLRSMEESQRLIAEKLISEIMFFGRTNRLNESFATREIKSPNNNFS